MVDKPIFIILFTALFISFIPKSHAESTLTVDDRAKLGEVYSLERLKQYPPAMSNIEDLYRHYPDNREIKWTYVRVLGFGGHWKDALNVFEGLCAVKCDDKMFVTFAHILEAQGPDPETLVYINKLAKQHPEENKIQSIYTEILSWNVKIPQGRQTIEELNAKYPHDLKLMKAYADVLIEQKKYTDAIDQMNELLSLSPNDKELLFQHAQVVSATGNHQQAVKELQNLVNEGFTNKEAIIMLGDELRLLGRNEEALKVYQEVINEK